MRLGAKVLLFHVVNGARICVAAKLFTMIVPESERHDWRGLVTLCVIFLAAAPWGIILNIEDQQKRQRGKSA